MGKFYNDDTTYGAVYDWALLSYHYLFTMCFRRKVNTFYYNTLLKGFENDMKVINRNIANNEKNKSNPLYKSNAQLHANMKKACNNNIQSMKLTLKTQSKIDENIWFTIQFFFKRGHYQREVEDMLKGCGAASKPKHSVKKQGGKPPHRSDPTKAKNDISPFDKRLEFIMSVDKNGEELRLKRPFSSADREVSLQGHLYNKNESTIGKNNKPIPEKTQTAINDFIDQAVIDDTGFYYGTTSLMNPYALVTLYGSKGGQNLINMSGQRRWYEIDSERNVYNSNLINQSTNPTTSTIIEWGQSDEHDRTPYRYSDFVFCKWWNKIPNNRLITLRRYPAPIIDNLNFPGMSNKKNPKVLLPPIATALTYFGEDTENKLGDLLSFSTGFKWETAKADIFKTNTVGGEAGSDAGPGGVFPNLAGLSKMLNIGAGNWNEQAVIDQQAIPPDPYEDGPYQNKILGPVNRIDEIAKRAPGIEFKMDGLKLTFEYSARPIGGVNPKAAILDILANFLTIGSVSAMFWGGQHRFMGKSVKYPFMGDNKGMSQWYAGKPVDWAQTTISQMATNAHTAGNSALDAIKGVFSALFGGGDGGSFLSSLTNLIQGKNAIGNIVRNSIYSQQKSPVPYLSGLKSLLIGEPVGEWHLTVGNPLNPIAMIGNLILKNIEVKFGDELGPDDFPLTLKVIVTLDHGMARDKDALGSMFNRGMGRLYSLPESMHGTAEFQTRVDTATKAYNVRGNSPKVVKIFASPHATHGSTDRSKLVKNPLGVSQSVWAPTEFMSVSADQYYYNASQSVANFRSVFRGANDKTSWVAQYALSS